MAAVGAFPEGRWSAFRIIVRVEMFMLALILIAGVRASGDFDPSNVLTWLLVVGYVGLLAASIVLYARLESRHR